MEQTAQKRQTAVKLQVKDILQSKYVREEGWKPNYLQLPDGRTASRVNVIGTIISLPMQDLKQQSFTFDDGSGSISVRSFDEKSLQVDVGDIILMIGRPREFGNERYIMPEIIKKVTNLKWIEVRRKELEKNTSPPIQHEQPIIAEAAIPQRICKIIKQKDQGSGVAIEDIASELSEPDIDRFVQSLIMEGEVFEVANGRLKMLD